MHRTFTASPERRPKRSGIRTLATVAVCALSLALAACGITPAPGTAGDVSATATALAAATGTAAAQATQTAQPVTIAMQLAQRGAVAANDVQLVATVTVTNHTGAPIHLAGEGCQNSYVHTSDSRLHTFAPPVVLQVADAPDHAI